MAGGVAEQADLARIPGSLLINSGTLDAIDGMLAAGIHANQNSKPLIFDPVGVGATSFRRDSAASESLRTPCGAKRFVALTAVGGGDHRASGRVAANSDQG
jgi:hypothetical protein